MVFADYWVSFKCCMLGWEPQIAHSARAFVRQTFSVQMTFHCLKKNNLCMYHVILFAWYVTPSYPPNLCGALIFWCYCSSADRERREIKRRGLTVKVRGRRVWAPSVHWSKPQELRGKDNWKRSNATWLQKSTPIHEKSKNIIGNMGPIYTTYIKTI